MLPEAGGCCLTTMRARRSPFRRHTTLVAQPGVGAGGFGGAAAALSHGVHLGATAGAVADDDQFVDGRLGRVAVLGELVVPVGDLPRLDLRGNPVAEGGLDGLLDETVPMEAVILAGRWPLRGVFCQTAK